MLEMFVHSFMLLISLSLQYYFMKKYDYNPAQEFVMFLQLGDLVKAGIKLLELAILVLSTLFITKVTLIIILKLIVIIGEANA